jgi:hypothetical protein
MVFSWCLLIIFTTLAGVTRGNDCVPPSTSGLVWTGGPFTCGIFTGSNQSCGCTCSSTYAYRCSPGYYRWNTNLGVCSGSKNCTQGVCGTPAFAWSANGASCELCPPGFYCPSSAPSPIICPVGNRCPSGSAAPIACSPASLCGNEGVSDAFVLPRSTGMNTNGGIMASGSGSDPHWRFSCCGVPTSSSSYSAPPVKTESGSWPQQFGGAAWLGLGGFGNSDTAYSLSYVNQASTPVSFTARVMCDDSCSYAEVKGSTTRSFSFANPGFRSQPTALTLTALPGANTIVFIVRQGGGKTGFYCAFSGLSFQCPSGFITTGTSCRVCPSGYICSSGSSYICPRGSYCPALSTNPTPCPIGTSSSTEGASSISTCVPCAKGAFSSSMGASSCTLCKAGTYGSTSGLTNPACSGLCSIGHYCLAGSSSATQNMCPAGTYGSVTGLTNSSCSGRWCVNFYLRRCIQLCFPFLPLSLFLPCSLTHTRTRFSCIIVLLGVMVASVRPL